mmetsp:Transcript_93400/g.267285  ORF Transcript_93400/g.267285 Transcript_93400/m.267285 type:complete len:221 (-) Transcript_93400:380-1042(-)
MTDPPLRPPRPPPFKKVREEWMKKWSGSMIAQLEALVDVEAEADADADPNVYAHADPKQLQRIDTLKASVAVVYQRVQRLRTKVLGKGGRMWKGYLEESRPEEPEEPAQPPAVSEVVKSQDLTTMRKSMNTALATVKKLDGELSAAVKSLSTTVEGANKSLGMTSTAEEIMSAATSNGGSSSADASPSSSSSSSASTGLGLDVPAGASSKFTAHMQGRLR